MNHSYQQVSGSIYMSIVILLILSNAKQQQQQQKQQQKNLKKIQFP